MFTIKKQAILLFVSKFTVLILKFFVPMILVRVLTKNEYGLYKQAILLFLFAAPVLQMGVAQSLFYLYASGNDNNKVVNQTFLIFFINVLLFSIAFSIFKPYVPLLFKTLADQTVIITYTGIYICLFYISFSFENLLIVEKKQRGLLIFVLIDEIIKVFMIISFGIIYKSASKVIIGLIIYSLIKFIAFMFYLYKNYKFPYMLKQITFVDIKQQLKYAFPLGFGKFIGELGRKADKYILSYFLSAADYATYIVGNFEIPVINIAYLSVGNTALPQVAAYYKTGDKKNAFRLWHKLIFYYSMITIPIVIFCEIFAKEIFIVLFTENYISSVPIFRIFILIFFVQMLSRGTIIKASNNTKYALYANAFSLISGLFLGIIFIKNFGLYGAVISSVISYYINASLQIYFSGRILSVRLRELLPWNKIVSLILVNLISILPLLLIKYLLTNYILVLFVSLIFYGSFVMLIYDVFGYIKIKTVINKILKLIKLKSDRLKK